ncbi:MAG: type II toxin-antitoxin system Phd/YefM family antitoxin [Desulfatitalea sp.]|nr:type II toxin-antitoxin system Phd/YefM family antitoxin [Desulfatitalea sp.]
MDLALQRVAACEATGQSSFLVQQWIPDGRRSLRVTVIGRRRIVYWRIQPDPQRFGASLAAGGHIDPDADPDLQAAAQTVVDYFCRRSGLITQNGEAKAVVIDIKQYEQMQESMAMLALIAQGQRDLAEGKYLPAQEVFRALKTRKPRDAKELG